MSGHLGGQLTAAGIALGVWPAERPRRIGYISFFPRPSPGAVPVFDAFFAGMRERGYEEGRDYVINWRHPGGNPDRLDALAAALVADGVDLLFCLTTAATMAAKRATAGRAPASAACVCHPVNREKREGCVPPTRNWTTTPQRLERAVGHVRRLVPPLADGCARFAGLQW